MTGLLMGSMRIDGTGNVLLIDKPSHCTSFDVVRRVRSMFHVKKVGHAGTLDPTASGLLIVCTGTKTKSISEFMGLAKEYFGSFQLGIRTPSYDLETEVTKRSSIEHISEDDVRRVMASFSGKQLQVPPMYSAVKHKGKPLYKLARKGRTVARAPREIEVMEFELLNFNPPTVEIRVLCSKGTYIRSLVHDIGERLGCGASLASLRRTKIGAHKVEDALTLEQLENLVKSTGRPVYHDRQAATS